MTVFNQSDFSFWTRKIFLLHSDFWTRKSVAKILINTSRSRFRRLIMLIVSSRMQINLEAFYTIYFMKYLMIIDSKHLWRSHRWIQRLKQIYSRFSTEIVTILACVTWKMLRKKMLDHLDDVEQYYRWW